MLVLFVDFVQDAWGSDWAAPAFPCKLLLYNASQGSRRDDGEEIKLWYTPCLQTDNLSIAFYAV
jgi:hypothetical protein